MRLIASFLLSAAILISTGACDDGKGANSSVAADGFDHAFCEKIRNTASVDIDSASIIRMVEQAKILKPMFDTDTSVKFADADDSTARHNAYDDISGKLYELLLMDRIDRSVIDQINGYEQVPLPE